MNAGSRLHRMINERVRDVLGGLHSADCLLRSVDFAEIEQRQREDRWEEAGERLEAEARALVCAGAQLLALCTNTMHRVADAVERGAGAPLVHIADATRARPIGGSWRSSPSAGPRRSCWDAPRSTSSSGRRTRPSRSSTPHAYTRSGSSTSHSRRRLA